MTVYAVGLRDETWTQQFASEYAGVRLVVAQDEAQARKVWHDIVPHDENIEDVSDEQLLVDPCEWEWTKLPEPTRPDKPCTWWPGGRYHGLDLWRGYGLTDENDVVCDDCGESYPDDFVQDVAVDDDEHKMCKFCLHEEIQPW